MKPNGLKREAQVQQVREAFERRLAEAGALLATKLRITQSSNANLKTKSRKAESLKSRLWDDED